MWNLKKFFGKSNDLNVSYLDEAIEHIAKRMLVLDPDTDEYKKANDQFIKLISQREAIVSSKRVDAKTWALIAANLAGILLIIGYERMNVLSSKAINQVSKLKL